MKVSTITKITTRRAGVFAVLWLAVLLQMTSAPAANWYISPTGSDNNSGTTSNTPLATIKVAQTKASSGDTVNIMGGTYNLATNVYDSVQQGVYASVNVISKNSITYQAMAGTRPVFNFSGVNPTGLRVAAFWVMATSVTFQGFDVVGVQENITNANNQSLGFGIWGCKKCTWNQVNVHDSECVGFYMEKVAANNLVYRCDSYNNTGINSFSFGNADGFGCHSDVGGTNNIFRECRAWVNSDDGYDCINASEPVTFDHCWSYLNGNNGGNANGFKIGGWASTAQNKIVNPLAVHAVFNCLSAKNGSHGFYANHQPGRAATWFNNTAYNNSSGDFDMLERPPPDYSSTDPQTVDIAGTNEVMHYNLAYVGTLTRDYNMTGALVSSNSWTLSVTVNNADFQGVDYTQMTNARNADGSLPTIAFMHVVNGSDLTGLGCFAVPPAPGLTATASNTQVTLNWTALTAATSYNLKRSTTNGGSYSIIGTNLTTTNFTDTGLAIGTTYYYVVSAFNLADESTNSIQASATTIPPMPTGLTATGTNMQVALTWTASPGAVSYKVKRSLTNGGPYTTNGIPAGTNFLDGPLAGNTTYYYVVSAVNAAGQSTNSAQAVAITAPATPTGLIATGGVQQVVLSWKASAGATSYNLKRALVSGGPFTVNMNLTITNYVDGGLEYGTAYYYVVSASNTIGESTNSMEIVAMTSPPPQFGSVTTLGSDLIFNGTGGLTNGIYYVLATTNMNLPFAEWPRLVTNSFDASGNFNFTNTADPGMLQQMYILQLP